MSLKDIVLTTAAVQHPPRLVLYAQEKFGKTSTAAQAPNPLFIGTDDGRRRLNVDGLPIPTSWTELTAQLDMVKAEAFISGYQSVVLDTLNGAVDLCAQHICATQFGGKWNDPRNGFFAWGGTQGWSATSEEFRRVLITLDECSKQGMWIIFLAHSDVRKVHDPSTGDYDQWMPAIDRRVWARVGQWADVILRGDFEMSFTELNGQRIAHSDGSRVLHCLPTASHVAGCRVGYELPEKLPLSWSEIESALMTTPVQVTDELHALWSRLDEAKATRALKFLGVSSEDEIGSAPINKQRELITRIKKMESSNG